MSGLCRRQTGLIERRCLPATGILSPGQLQPQVGAGRAETLTPPIRHPAVRDRPVMENGWGKGTTARLGESEEGGGPRGASNPSNLRPLCVLLSVDAAPVWNDRVR